MNKVINCFGQLDNGDIVMDLELLPERMVNFKPFDLDKYNEVVNIVNKKEDLTLNVRLSNIDKLLFEDNLLIKNKPKGNKYGRK